MEKNDWESHKDKVLIDAKKTGENDVTILCLACHHVDLPMVQYLTSREDGADIYHDNLRAFWLADLHGASAIVLHLLRQNYDWKNQTVRNQYVLLNLAMKYDWESHKDKVLIDVTKTDENGETILFRACQKRTLPMMKYLLADQRVRLSHTDSKGRDIKWHANAMEDGVEKQEALELILAAEEQRKRWAKEKVRVLAKHLKLPEDVLITHMAPLLTDTCQE